MIRNYATLIIFTVLIWGIFSIPCYSAYNPFDKDGNIARINSATDLKAAYIYGGSIAISGIAIGMGLYFGLRSKKKG